MSNGVQPADLNRPKHRDSQHLHPSVLGLIDSLRLFSSTAELRTFANELGLIPRGGDTHPDLLELLAYPGKITTYSAIDHDQYVEGHASMAYWFAEVMGLPLNDVEF